MIAEF
jgi:alpha-glucosidase (family GH31 glycosyl hydrolase)